MDRVVWSRLNISFCPVLEQSLKCISVATVYETVVLNFIFFLEFSRAKNIRNFTGETLSRNIWRSRRNGKCPPIFARSAVTKLYFNLFPFSCSRSFHLRSRYCYFNEVSRRGETVLKRFSTIVSVITGTRLRLHFISCFINFQRSSNPRSNCR